MFDCHISLIENKVFKMFEISEYNSAQDGIQVMNKSKDSKKSKFLYVQIKRQKDQSKLDGHDQI